MFQIVGKEKFEQWDLDQLVTCDCLKEGDAVVFSGYGKAYETTAFAQDGKVVADVPNFLLQKAGSFRVDLGWGLDVHMDCRTTFTVEAKEKPEDYVCTCNIKQRNSTASGGGVQPDWNAVEGEPGYIQNRPFGKREVILFPETEVAFVDMDGMMMADLPANVELEADTEYKIVYNAEEYLRKPCLMDGHPVGLGNSGPLGGDDTGEPFFIMIDMDESGVLTAMILALDGTTSTTVSCKGYPEKTLDIKYIPNAAENVIDLTALGVTALDGMTSYATLPEDTINQIRKQLATGQVTLRFAVNIAFNDILAGVTVDGIRYLRLVAPTVVITEPSEAYTVTARYQDALFVFEFNGTQVSSRAENRSPS